LLQPQQWSGDGAGVGAGEAGYADAAASGGRGDGDDGVIKMHRNIVVGAEA